MGTAEETKPSDRLTYRKQDVDETLEEHDRRITRLEKAAYIGLGYVLATSPEIASKFFGLI